MRRAAETIGFQPGSGERKALIDRVLASRAFETSHRLRDLLLYLAERSEADESIREQDIGVSVFGRQPGYDTSHDTLVRVQISQLRKKLQQYFEDEGRDEQWEILIPKGNYLLTFRALREVALVELSPPPDRPVAATSWRIPVLGLAVALTLIALGWWLGKRAPAPAAPSAKARLWTDIFGGVTPYLVLADANLIEFENDIGHQLTPGEYDTKNFEGLAASRIKEEQRRRDVLRALSRPLTSVVDAQAAQRIVLWAAEAGGHVEIAGARDLSMRQIAGQSTILLGSRRANPWINFFEEHLNFQTGFEEGKPPRAWFVNRKPHPGEQAEYHVDWGKEGYCRVAYLPNPKSTGSTLLLSGTDLYSSEGGADYITREDRVRELRAKLGVKDNEKMPRFEVLLRTRVVSSAAPEFQVVAWRRY